MLGYEKCPRAAEKRALVDPSEGAMLLGTCRYDEDQERANEVDVLLRSLRARCAVFARAHWRPNAELVHDDVPHAFLRPEERKVRHGLGCRREKHTCKVGFSFARHFQMSSRGRDTRILCRALSSSADLAADMLTYSIGSGLDTVCGTYTVRALQPKLVGVSSELPPLSIVRCRDRARRWKRRPTERCIQPDVEPGWVLPPPFPSRRRWARRRRLGRRGAFSAPPSCPASRRRRRAHRHGPAIPPSCCSGRDGRRLQRNLQRRRHRGKLRPLRRVLRPAERHEPREGRVGVRGDIGAKPLLLCRGQGWCRMRQGRRTPGLLVFMAKPARVA